jgi:hypothetical protein
VDEPENIKNLGRTSDYRYIRADEQPGNRRPTLEMGIREGIYRGKTWDDAPEYIGIGIFTKGDDEERTKARGTAIDAIRALGLEEKLVLIF